MYLWFNEPIYKFVILGSLGFDSNRVCNIQNDLNITDKVIQMNHAPLRAVA